MAIKKKEKQEKVVKINKIFNSVWFVIIIGVLILLKTILFYYNTVAISDRLYSDTVIGTIFFVIMIVCFLCVLPNRGRIVGAIVINVLISLLLFCDNVYYNYSNSVLSVAQLINIQYGEEIMGTLPMLLKLYQILYFVDIFVLFILLALKKLKIEKKEKRQKNN